MELNIEPTQNEIKHTRSDWTKRQKNKILSFYEFSNDGL